MRITNKFNLPQTIVNALHRPTYSKGGADLSATELINSPRIVQLRRMHMDEIEQDASEMVWSLFGTAIHGVLEHGQGTDHVVEERLSTEIDGWKISGAIDLQTIESGNITISDYKTTGAWSVMNSKVEWEIQLNIYAWLVERVKAMPVSRIEIVAIIRDWSRRDAQVKEGYPEAPIKALEMVLWPFERRERYILDRIALHSAAHFSAEVGDELPECTSEEMWEKPAVWAVKKTGGVRAKVLCLSEQDAKYKLAELGKGFEIEFRPGERTRCQNYCSVSQFCSQWKSYQ